MSTNRKIPWNKGKKIGPQSKEHRIKISKSTTGKKRGAEFGKKMSKIVKGSRLKKTSKGSEHWNWKGGLTPVNKAIRRSMEYSLWRTAVFTRDSFRCIWCGSKVKIQADHIKPFAFYPELRFAIDNGRTLCSDCHRKTDTYGKPKLGLSREE